MKRELFPFLLFAAAQLCGQPAGYKIEFEKDVRPVLESKCFGCHGPEKQLSGLRLDRRQLALRGGDYGKVILPGDSAGSKLIHRLVSSNEGLQMPPTGPLDPSEISILRAWIDQGADFGVARPPNRAPRKPEPAGLRPLLEAIAADDLGALGRSLRADPSLAGAADGAGSTALMHAAGRGSLAAMNTLLEAGAPVEAKNRRGATALFWALGELEKVALLVSRKASAVAKTNQGRTPLHNAVRLNSGAGTVPLLLAKGADVNARDAAGVTPLYLAAMEGRLESVRLLLAAGARPNDAALTGVTPLMQAAQSGCAECVRLLIERGADAKAVTRKNGSALERAAYRGHLETVKLLLAKGAPVNLMDADGYTPLKFAAYSELAGPEVVRLLLASGADPKAGGEETALHLAMQKGETEVTRILRQAVKTAGN
ncbi:MAG: ankyrin repeat domain-containing protein [Candidatus Solibacter usitatus]|nr:ankyrin repeat domain-containing protein [Candidatus Solibacter usitatus]